MKYLLMIYGNQSTWDSWTEADYNAVVAAHSALQEELVATGELIGCEGLTTEEARTVRVVDGTPAVTDGPFTEAKEVLAGYYLVECDSLERATEIAARIPEAQYDPVEVRRIMDRADIGMEG
ncbi:MAG TPA: YciI family protein [Natronosporangium sp.]